jgi:hypothetical protein
MLASCGMLTYSGMLVKHGLFIGSGEQEKRSVLALSVLLSLVSLMLTGNGVLTGYIVLAECSMFAWHSMLSCCDMLAGYGFTIC